MSWNLIKFLLLLGFAINLTYSLPFSKHEDSDSSSSKLKLLKHLPSTKVAGAAAAAGSPFAFSRVKRAQAYIRYLRQRKMRQADERELRERLAAKVIPAQATTPGSIFSRLPIPVPAIRLPSLELPPLSQIMPMLNATGTAVLSRVPPNVLNKINSTTNQIMSQIPPQVLSTVAMIRENGSAYFESVRGPVTQTVNQAIGMGQQMIGSIVETYNGGKGGKVEQIRTQANGLISSVSSASPEQLRTELATRANQLMGMIAGAIGLPEPEPGQPPGSRANQLMRMVAGMMNRGGSPGGPESGAGTGNIDINAITSSLMAAGQRAIQMLSTNPKINSLVTRISSMINMRGGGGGEQSSPSARRS